MIAKRSGLQKQVAQFFSHYLQRIVNFDTYLNSSIDFKTPRKLLLFNDGQDLSKMSFEQILDSGNYGTYFCVGIYSGPDRLQEYGMIMGTDFAGRGAKASLYLDFLEKELLPCLSKIYPDLKITSQIMAGFSLGGLSALDICWNRPDLFSRVGIFSAALWWRSVDCNDPCYSDEHSRMMHVQVRNTLTPPPVKFFLQCGCLDETADRNGNGIIDAVDDTLDFILELEKKGYSPTTDFKYLQMEDGAHDCETWGRALPLFLDWCSSES